jgi:hypothetical protein
VGKEPQYPLNRKLGGPQSWSGSSGEEKNSQPLLELELPIIQPIAQCYITEVSQLNRRLSCSKPNGENTGWALQPVWNGEKEKNPCPS